jgi:diguanylate cyclase (GGDEF)-like protein
MNAFTAAEALLIQLDPGPEPRRPRLLVVDDQRINIRALYEVFSADHQVLVATDGEQALVQCAVQQLDLVLLDVMMPGIDGFEVCRRLKADAATRDIPIIFVTAHNDVAAETRGLELGAVDFISKPINPAIVRARVKTHLTLKAHSDLLRQWVYFDGLTGAHNRRCFDERLAVECARATREGSALSVILLDVDFFKRFNDRYGHQAGDDCLRRIAEAMKAVVKRPADLVARYGGEEFVCLLPQTPLAGALVVARELCQRIHALKIENADSSAATAVTASLGVCTRPIGTLATAAQLLRGADVQLYAAKSNGRNQICGTELAS